MKNKTVKSMPSSRRMMRMQELLAIRRVRLRLGQAAAMSPAPGDGCIVGPDMVGSPDMAGRGTKTYGRDSLLARSLLHRRSGSNRRAKTGYLWLDVDALIQSCVFLLPASLTHEKPPQLFMRLHPKHRIDLVFLKHRVPGGFINLWFRQLEIVA